jgi:hypothetical protein
LASPHFLAALSIPMESRSEDLLMAKSRDRTREERAEQSRRMSFVARHPVMTADRRDVV